MKSGEEGNDDVHDDEICIIKADERDGWVGICIEFVSLEKSSGSQEANKISCFVLT